MYAILIVIEVSIRQLTRLTTGPGRFTAEGVIWIAIVNILATFQIVKSKDIFGEEINVKKEFTAGIAVCVKYYTFLSFPDYYRPSASLYILLALLLAVQKKGHLLCDLHLHSPRKLIIS
jgi:hypothetical protein